MENKKTINFGNHQMIFKTMADEHSDNVRKATNIMWRTNT